MISSERLHAIRAFVQAVQSGGFSRAAQQLGLSRSTVGKAVARLEQRLQVRLFQRTTRSLSLTDEGLLFYDDCLKALAALEVAENRLAARALAPEGRLRLSLPVLFGQKWVMPPLLALAERHPQLQIEALFSNRAADLAEEGIDLAVRIGSRFAGRCGGDHRAPTGRAAAAAVRRARLSGAVRGTRRAGRAGAASGDCPAAGWPPSAVAAVGRRWARAAVAAHGQAAVGQYGSGARRRHRRARHCHAAALAGA